MKETVFELIIAIINRGYSDTVMEASRAAGAKGGTVLQARGAGSHEAEKFFGISIQPEKEIVLILTEAETKRAIMKAVCQSAGLNTPGRGLTFSLPVDDVLGMTMGLPADLSAPADPSAKTE